MHSHLQANQNPTEKQEEESQPMKYHIGVKPSRVSNNVYNTLLLSYSAHSHLIVNHGQDLMVYNSKLKQITKAVHHNHTAPYIKSTHSHKWKCLFLLDSSQKLTVYSYDQLLLLGKDIDLKSIRHCLDFMYLDQYNAFLVLTPEHLKIVYVEVNTNHLRSLFTNAYKFKMKQTGVKVLEPAYFLQFSNKIRRFGEYLLINNSENIKIILHSMDHNFTEKQSEQDKRISLINQGLFQLALGDIDTPYGSKHSKRTIIHLLKICESPEQITEIMYNPQQCVLVCGSNIGNLKVFKINTKNIIATTSPSLKSREITIESKSQLAFKLSLHNSKPVISIQMYSPKLILSVGADEYIEVVSFDQMASIQKFKSSSHLADIVFVSNSTFLGVKTIQFDQFLYSYEIALNYELLVQHNSQVLHALYKQEMCLLMLTDNSLNVFQLKQQGQTKNNLSLRKQSSMKKLEGNKKRLEIQTVQETNQPSLLPKQSFVPPRCKSILYIEAYPYLQRKQKKTTQNGQEQFWVLTDQSEIYRYTFTSKTVNNEKISKFEIIGIHELYHFEDTYKHETKQKVCTMKFVDLVPVYYDSDIREKSYAPNLDKVEDVKPIAFGCNTGELLVCSSQEPTKIISRVRCFGEPVVCINCCYYPDQPPPAMFKQQQNKQQPDSQLNNKKRRSPHVRRLIIFSSHKQIVAVMLSNYLTPNIIYKVVLNSAFFATKQLSSTCTVILNGNIPKLLFPCYHNDNKLRLWTPQKILHENTITCLQYCNGIKVVTGDEIGKIVLWNLYSQVLAHIVVSETNLIELCYCWNDNLLFGYQGKIFQLEMGKNNDVNVQPLELISNQKWVSETSYQLSLNSNPTFIYSFITFQNHSQSTKLQFASEAEKTPKKNKPKDGPQVQNPRKTNLVDMQQVRTHQSVQKYVENMKKSLIKLSHEAQTNQPQIPISSSFNERVEAKAGKKRKKHISTSKHIPQKPVYFQQEQHQEKMKRAISILGKYRQAKIEEQRNKKNEISLPQIRNVSVSLRSEQTEEPEITKRKKHRNKQYQFLFHFPNTGLYTQLISKNMLE